MHAKVRIIFALLVATFVAWPAAAQMGMGMRAPQLRGIWNPMVGSGGLYEMESKSGEKSQLEVAIVGKDMVGDKPAYWLEMSVTPRGSQKMYIKHLMVLDGEHLRITRVIIQPAGEQATELPTQMMMGGHSPEQVADVSKDAEKVGTESITTPAGNFECEHYRLKDGSADVWISPKVAPYGLVKMTGRDANMTLLKTVTDAKSHITGTPEKFNPMGRMHSPGRP